MDCLVATLANSVLLTSRRLVEKLVGAALGGELVHCSSGLDPFENPLRSNSMTQGASNVSFGGLAG